jgi:hypothetical protein
MNETPFYDPVQQPDGTWKSEVGTSRPKATFQWPPDCRWPSIDHGGVREN